MARCDTSIVRAATSTATTIPSTAYVFGGDGNGKDCGEDNKLAHSARD